MRRPPRDGPLNASITVSGWGSLLLLPQYILEIAEATNVSADDAATTAAAPKQLWFVCSSSCRADR